MGYRVFKLVLFVCALCVFLSVSAVGAENIKAVIGTGGLDLKERPDIDSDTIVRINGGEAILILVCLSDSDTISNISGHWCLVRYRGVDGWAFDSDFDVNDPRAELLYRDVDSITELLGRLHRLHESYDFEETARLSEDIIKQIEDNFTRHQIIESAYISGVMLGLFSDRIESLVYLHRFSEVRTTYDYLMNTYPGIKLENDFATAREIIRPYIIFMNRYSSARLFDDPKKPMKKLKEALEERDISLVSKLGVPGVFEIWVAHTDWVVKLGDMTLGQQEWLSQSWNTAWEIMRIDEKRDDAGDVVGYCIVTEQWDINYYEIRVNRVDFCVDRLSDGTYAFNYLILYTEPIQ